MKIKWPWQMPDPPHPVVEGQNAKRLLENELLQRTLEEMKRDAYESWLSIAPANADAVHELKLYCEAVKQFELRLEMKVAAMDKHQHDEKQEQQKWA